MKATFADVLEIRNGRNQKDVENPEGTYPIYGSGGIMGRADDYICPANTVIIGRKGSINKPLFVTEPFWNVDTAFGLVADETRLLPRYLYYFCVHFDFEKLNTTVTIPSLTKANLLKITLELPEIEIQKQVVAALSKIEGIIQKRQQELSALDDLIRARFVEMFGDPVLNPKGFPVYRMDEVVEFQGGSQPDKKYFEYEPTPDNIRLIQIRDYKTDNYITYIPKAMAKRFCTADDIMIGRYGPPIFQILQGIEGSFNVALMKATPKMGRKEFVRYFLKQDCLLHYLEGMSKRTAGQDGIQMDKLKSYPFPMPPLDLQEQFEDFVTQVDKSKDAIKKSLAETQTLFDSLMQQYFG